MLEEGEMTRVFEASAVFTCFSATVSAVVVAADVSFHPMLVTACRAMF